jgi:hypothetical protein
MSELDQGQNVNNVLDEKHIIDDVTKPRGGIVSGESGVIKGRVVRALDAVAGSGFVTDISNRFEDVLGRIEAFGSGEDLDLIKTEFTNLEAELGGINDLSVLNAIAGKIKEVFSRIEKLDLEKKTGEFAFVEDFATNLKIVVNKWIDEFFTTNNPRILDLASFVNNYAWFFDKDKLLHFLKIVEKVPWSLEKSGLYADLIRLVPEATAKDLLAILISDNKNTSDKVAEFDLAFCLTDLLKLHKSHLGLFKVLELVGQDYYEIVFRDKQFSEASSETKSRYKELVEAELLKVAREVVSWSKSLNPEASREANIDFRLSFAKKMREFFILNEFAGAKELDRLILSLELDLPVDKGLEAFYTSNLNAQEFSKLAERIRQISVDMHIEIRRGLYMRFLWPYVGLDRPELFDLIAGQLDLVLQLYTPGLYPTWLVSLVKNYQNSLAKSDKGKLDFDKDLRDEDMIETFVRKNGAAKLFEGLKMALASQEYLSVVSVLANMPKYIAKHRDYNLLWQLIDAQPLIHGGEELSSLKLQSINLNLQSINRFTLSQCRSIVLNLESLLFKTVNNQYGAVDKLHDEFGDFKKDPILLKTLIGRVEILDPSGDLRMRLERAYVWRYWRQNAYYIENEVYPELPGNFDFKNEFSFREAKDKGVLKLLSGDLFVADGDYRVDSSLIDKVSQIDVPKEHLSSVGLSLVVDLWSLDFPKDKSDANYHNLTNIGIYFNGLFDLLKGKNVNDFEIVFVNWLDHLQKKDANIGLVVGFLLDHKFDFLNNNRIHEVVQKYKIIYPKPFEVDEAKTSGEQISAPMGSSGVGQNAKTVEFKAPVVATVLQQDFDPNYIEDMCGKEVAGIYSSLQGDSRLRRDVGLALETLWKGDVVRDSKVDFLELLQLRLTVLMRKLRPNNIDKFRLIVGHWYDVIGESLNLDKQVFDGMVNVLVDLSTAERDVDVDVIDAPDESAGSMPPVLQQDFVDKASVIDGAEESNELALRSGFSAFFNRMKSGFSDFVNRRFVPIAGVLAVSGMALAGLGVYQNLKQDDRREAVVRVDKEYGANSRADESVGADSTGGDLTVQQNAAPDADFTMEDAPNSTYEIAKGDGFEMGFRKAYGLTAKADFKDFLVKLAESHGDQTGVSGYQYFLAGLKLADANNFGVDGKTVVHPRESVQVSGDLLNVLDAGTDGAPKMKASLEVPVDANGSEATGLANVDTGAGAVKVIVDSDTVSGLSFGNAEAGVAPVAFTLQAMRLGLDNSLIAGSIVASSEANKIANDELADPNSSLNKAWEAIGEQHSSVERTYADVAKGWEEISADLALIDLDSEINKGWFEDSDTNWAVG